LRAEEKDLWKAALMVKRTAKMMADPWDVAMDMLKVFRRIVDLAVLLECWLDDH
jgi:hypothetical protein